MFVSDGTHLLRSFFLPLVGFTSLKPEMPEWTHTKKKGKNKDQRVFPDEICSYCAKPLTEDQVNKALASLGLIRLTNSEEVEDKTLRVIPTRERLHRASPL